MEARVTQLQDFARLYKKDPELALLSPITSKIREQLEASGQKKDKEQIREFLDKLEETLNGQEFKTHCIFLLLVSILYTSLATAIGLICATKIWIH